TQTRVMMTNHGTVHTDTMVAWTLIAMPTENRTNSCLVQYAKEAMRTMTTGYSHATYWTNDVRNDVWARTHRLCLMLSNRSNHNSKVWTSMTLSVGTVHDLRVSTLLSLSSLTESTKVSRTFGKLSLQLSTALMPLTLLNSTS